MSITITVESPESFKEEIASLNEDHFSEDPRKDFQKLNVDWEISQKFFDDGSLLPFIVRDSGKIVGYSTVFLILHHHTKDCVTASIDSIYVSEEYRGRGLAKDLLNEIEGSLKSVGISYLSISFRDDEKADRFLDGLGYSKTEVTYAKGLEN